MVHGPYIHTYIHTYVYLVRPVINKWQYVSRTCPERVQKCEVRVQTDSIAMRMDAAQGAMQCMVDPSRTKSPNFEQAVHM